MINDFLENLKEQVNDENNKLSFYQLDLIEIELENMEEFLKGEKSSTIEVDDKKKQIRDEAFYKRINKILGFDCKIKIEDLIEMKNKANILREKYGYDNMSEEEKEKFEEKAWHEQSKTDEEECPERIDKTEGHII